MIKVYYRFKIKFETTSMDYMKWFIYDIGITYFRRNKNGRIFKWIEANHYVWRNKREPYWK
ncbi:Conserved hypothetical protein [Clostridium acetobutylicum EA 2018]|uniref:Uncharacterized protein n=1 Tax=Clostridium acetobutylicum (strain ATCC 824 / DSM 792 / JCM 1419 / IAM 19013 / LMG 5710 / NBRC 13948 / NRRL B-527 / VKM B-1787 / 2291 / W) TaxID=272562 RepID=Q97GU5_CLOAB|nr:Hypothetical protein CA_C2270 [Clostridium acetobutylicum ATCC 824]ADZ21322.1 Conserved hypothetical protein [Clostridium acetobutylicum EA 2018]AEI32257.1 hypothetical protein SMB_G2303 [Clostridium acetobutylicum DSM 1731]AWV79350.1 hypothetical protein DK921_04405 [Clostridium acetobutylicum]PSM07310.1 hypothetical protein C7T89_04405 [Clostridium sp. NJ4]